jgi:mono/diheme cytochrome c family protein
MTGRERCLAALTPGTLVAVVVLGAGIAASLGLHDVGADRPHTAIVVALLDLVRARSIAVRASAIRVPSLRDPEMIEEGVSHYDEMCTQCHLAPGVPENEMRPGLNPRPPVLARASSANPAFQFWTIKHGIKMTGMPAWGPTRTDQEIWDMVAFLQILPKLSPAEYRALVTKAAKHHPHEMNRSDDIMRM